LAWPPAEDVDGMDRGGGRIAVKQATQSQSAEWIELSIRVGEGHGFWVRVRVRGGTTGK